MKRSSSLLILGLVLGLAQTGFSETIYLRDGSRVSGTISSESIEVATPNGTIHIPKDKIAGIGFRPAALGPGLEAGERVLTIGLGASVPLPAQGYNEIARTGFATGVEGFVQKNEHWGLGLRVDQATYGAAHPNFNGTSGEATVSAGDILFEGHYVLLPNKRISPFFVGGAGINFYSEELEETPPGGPTREIEGESGGLAADFGAGVQFLFCQRMIAEASARWSYYTVDNKRFGFTGAQSTSFLASIGWRFE